MPKYIYHKEYGFFFDKETLTVSPLYTTRNRKREYWFIAKDKNNTCEVTDKENIVKVREKWNYLCSQLTEQNRLNLKKTKP